MLHIVEKNNSSNLLFIE